MIGPSSNKKLTAAQRLERLRIPVFLALVGFGAVVSLAERFKPGLIEPLRQEISTGMSGYFRPLLEFTQGGRRLTHRVAQLWGVESDYRRLERELTQTRLELQLTREQLRSMGRISGLRQWRGPEELEFILAEVIGFSFEGSSAEWIINRGARDGMEIGLPVVGQNGLAGVIREVSDRSARVQALTDPLSAVGVAEADNRSRGIVFGAGRDMPLEFIPENENAGIVSGTQLITSGFENSVYPKGIVVGTIKAKRNNFRGVTYGVVEPAEAFNALEEVLVITRAPGVAPSSPLEGLGQYSFAMEPDETMPGAVPPGGETSFEAPRSETSFEVPAVSGEESPGGESGSSEGAEPIGGSNREPGKNSSEAPS